MTLPAHVHMLPLYSEFSPRTGNAVSTVVTNVARRHAAAGGSVAAIVSEDRAHQSDVLELRIANVGRSRGKQYFTERERRVNGVALGLLGLPPSVGGNFYLEAARAMRRGENAVLFLHNEPWAIPHMRRGGFQGPIVLWAHNDLFARWPARAVRRYLAMTDLTIACSSFIADKISEDAGSFSTRLVSLLNGVDTATFYPPESRTLGSALRILFLGRVRPEKGPDLFIDALLQLKADGRMFESRIVGNSTVMPGTPSSQFERDLAARAAPLGDQLIFEPFAPRDQVPDIFRWADVLVAPVRWDEPCGLVVSEALASGCAVVTVNRGGIPESTGDAALFVPANDPVAIAAVLQRLIEHPKELRDAQRRARERALELDWRRRYDELSARLGSTFSTR